MSGKSGEVRIRPMEIGDLDRVMALAESLRDAPQWPRKAYEAAVDAEAIPQRIALVAESVEAGPVGFAIVVVIPPQAEMESIAVAVEAHRKGVARRLFAGLAEQLTRNNVTEIQLEVRASNMRARLFYGALGFEQSGCRPRYYADPEEDAILMHLSPGGLVKPL